CISCYLGVTEPALFGVNLKYGFPLVCGMIGSGLAAVISIGTGVTAYSIGVGGLPGILSIMPQYWVSFLIAMLVAIAVPFVLPLLVGKVRLSMEERLGEDAAPAAPAAAETAPAAPAAAAEAGAVSVKAPLSGRV